MEDDPTWEAYLSDESSFYGDENMKGALEQRVGSLDLQQFWTRKETAPSITEMADINIVKLRLQAAKDVVKGTQQLYNVYQGNMAGRQLGETVDQFLKRLPPRASKATPLLSWIFIANPHIPRPRSTSGKYYDQSDDGPPVDDGTSYSQFVVLGRNLLEELTDDVAEISKKLAGEPSLKVKKAQNKRRDEVVAKLKEIAIEKDCKSGKWLLFVSPEEVDDVWAVIARATARGDLGIAAKVARDGGEDARAPRIMCVYTKDFADRKDIARVVAKLKELQVIKANGRAIYYKADAYTFLGIKSSNEWNIKASLYSSSEFLSVPQQRISGILKRKQ